MSEMDPNGLSMLDTRFNRKWDGRQHAYLDNTAERDEATANHSGWVKVKLLHGKAQGLALPPNLRVQPEYGYLAAKERGYLSIVAPDLLLLEGDPVAWIQPLHFLANVLRRDSDEITGTLWVDVSCSQTLQVRFRSKNLVMRYEDGSELYKCEIEGPPNLRDYVTGPVRWEPGKRPLIQVFHHTTEEARTAILDCGYFKPSFWNIQGTERLRNVGYVYFTCLPKLDCDECLRAVAMASDGRIVLRRDPCPYPAVFMADNLAAFGADILELEVYRESTRNRTATLAMWIDPGYASPQHLLRHYDGQRQFWYEVISAFTVRVAVDPEARLPFVPKAMECDYSATKHFDYSVLGDAWRLDGLLAPFKEEETESILKIERVPGESNVLEYWFDNANSLRFPVLNPSQMEFERKQTDEEA